MAVEVKITVDENTSLESVIAALTTLAGGSFLPEKLAKREGEKEKKNAKKEGKTPEEKSDKKPEAAADENTGDDAGSAEPDEKDAEDDKPTYTLTDVRAKLVQLSQAGKNKEVSALLKKHGAKNISSLDPEKYADVMAEADEL